MKAVEASAKTREQAIQNALKELGVEMYEVDKIEVIDEGSKGLFGLGARPVRVRLVVENMHEEPQREAAADTRPRRGGNRNRNDRDRGEKRESRNGREPRSEQDSGGERTERGGRDNNRGRGGEGKPRGENDNRRRDNRSEKSDKPAETQGRRNERGDRNERNERDGQRNRPERNRNRPARDRNEKAPAQAGADAAGADEIRDDKRDVPVVDTIEPITDAQGAEASALLEEMIAKMGITATAAFVRTEDGSARVNVASEDSAILIGRKGRNLSALQYLVNRMISLGDTNENTERIVVDVEGYVDRRRESLQELALSMASRAKESQRNMRLKPLSPQERRIIHVTLQDDEDIRTFSLGESLFRSVVISPKNATRPERSRSGRGSRGGRRRGGRGRSGDTAKKSEGQDIDVGTFGD